MDEKQFATGGGAEITSAGAAREIRPPIGVSRIAAYAAAAFFGAVVSLAGVLALARWLGPPAIPEITDAALSAARDSWQRRAPANYELDVQVTGRDVATFTVRVRGGAVVHVLRDGEPMSHQRTWGTWTVPGMFETIERDLESADRGRAGELEPGALQLLLRGVFDPEWGYPKAYHRIELHRFLPNKEVSWEITRFLVER
jgi:hypothetical protein